ncbi:hypothetical protein RB195_022701 [Necator americanus]|uniref:BAR domain-containing protein n=1 Tax=Necator americanus TaxID=51031 RepID=A0ABR1EG91_NECAM
MDNVDEEYDRLVEHLHDCTKKAESFKTTTRRLSLQIPELIRQRGAARAPGNLELTFELARHCTEAIKEDLKERGTVKRYPYDVSPRIQEANKKSSHWRVNPLWVRQRVLLEFVFR